MFLFKPLTIFTLNIILSPLLVYGEITVDSNELIPKKLKKGQGVIMVVGESRNVAISAVHRTPETTADCHGNINEITKTYEGPCFLSTQDQQQTFHAKCLDSPGSATIVFHKDGEKGNTVETQAVDGIWTGFDDRMPLKQSNMSTKKQGVKVILNCYNNKST